MGSITPPPALTQWGQWPQHVPQHYAMIEPNGMVRYDTRPPASYMMAPSYSTHVPPMVASHYPTHHAVHYYDQDAALASAGLPYRQPYGGPSGNVRVANYEDHRMKHTLMPREDMKPSFSNVRSSSESSDSHVVLADTIASNPSVTAKTIDLNETIDPRDRVVFKTDIDVLMRAIQGDGGNGSKEQESQGSLTPAMSPKHEDVSACSSPFSQASLSTGSTGLKRFVCDGPNCNKSFSQKARLENHRRTHDGKRPYKCTFKGCTHASTQPGNLRAHMRRHTGEKPFSCKVCGKGFASKGNVKPHERRHIEDKPLFKCMLGDCRKTFSTLGNMKNHQNTFHRELLQELTAKFAQYMHQGYVPEEHRDLFEYFRIHYKNSNKGVKGRGKGRKVAGAHNQIPKKAGTGSYPQSPISPPETPCSDSDYTLPENHHAHIPAVNYAPMFPMSYGGEHTRHMGFTDRLY